MREDRHPRFPALIRPVLDMSPQAAAERLKSFERDPSCCIGPVQVEKDREIVRKAKERLR